MQPGARCEQLTATGREQFGAAPARVASGSRATAQHVASPPQANTPNTQSEGEGSVTPNRPPRIASAPGAQPSAQMHSRPITPADVCVILEDRITREKKRIAELVAKVGSVDQEFTEVDMNEVNDLKQSIMDCRRKLEEAKQGRIVEAIPRPAVRLPSNDPPTPGDITPRETRKSRSRPRSHVRGRSCDRGEKPMPSWMASCDTDP